MAKASALTSAVLKVSQMTPKAAALPRNSGSASKAAAVAEPKTFDQVPLQVRLPREEVRAIKVAAAERDMTISGFMLACFHAHMKSDRHA
jgi:hypothetical protein